MRARNRTNTHIGKLRQRISCRVRHPHITHLSPRSTTQITAQITPELTISAAIDTNLRVRQQIVAEPQQLPNEKSVKRLVVLAQSRITDGSLVHHNGSDGKRLLAYGLKKTVAYVVSAFTELEFRLMPELRVKLPDYDLSLCRILATSKDHHCNSEDRV